MTTPPPPNWYPAPDGSGRQQWWDGQQWSANYTGPAAAPQMASSAPTHTSPPQPKQPMGRGERIAIGYLQQEQPAGPGLPPTPIKLNRRSNGHAVLIALGLSVGVGLIILFAILVPTALNGASNDNASAVAGPQVDQAAFVAAIRGKGWTTGITGTDQQIIKVGEYSCSLWEQGYPRWEVKMNVLERFNTSSFGSDFVFEQSLLYICPHLAG